MRTWSKQLLAIGAVVFTTILGLQRVAQAAIVIQVAFVTGLPQSDLLQYRLSAVGTNGEVINTFSHPTLTPSNTSHRGVHNVANVVTNSGTPSTADQIPGLFDSSWATYDTHLLFGGYQDLALDLGQPLTETNDGATTGQLGLTSAYGAPRSGFGNLSSAVTTFKVLRPEKAGSNIPFLQVVMLDNQYAHLDIEIAANGGQVVQIWDNYSIGYLVDFPSGVDANLGVTAAPVVDHLFKTKEGRGANWRDLTLVSPIAPAIHPTLNSNGQFTWQTQGSPRSATGVNYTWHATVSDGSGNRDVVALNVILVPEPNTIMLISLALLGFGVRTRIKRRSTSNYRCLLPGS
jgi:hypothetical protein